MPAEDPLNPAHDSMWQMSAGEQAAIAGLVAQLEPRLAIELGTAQGACAGWLASRIPEVHSFDLSPPSLDLPEGVTTHVGDSHQLLPTLLAQLAQEGRNVDLAIVDGDHSAAGVRQDVEDLLDSPAVGRTLVVIHDTANERVRLGLDAIRFAAWPKVAYVHLDWVPGQLFSDDARDPAGRPLANELWYGLGLVVVDAAAGAYASVDVQEQRYFPAAPLLAAGREALIARDGGAAGPRASGMPDPEVDLQWELDRTREEIVRRDAELAGIFDSPSWRVTAPLRRAKGRLQAARNRLTRLRKRGNADSTGVG